MLLVVGLEGMLIGFFFCFFWKIRGCQTSDSEADLRSIKSTILVSI